MDSSEFDKVAYRYWSAQDDGKGYSDLYAGFYNHDADAQIIFLCIPEKLANHLVITHNNWLESLGR